MREGKEFHINNCRTIMSKGLGCCWLNSKLPIADVKDTPSTVLGGVKRCFEDVPPIGGDYLKKCNRVVRRLLNKLTPLDPDTDLSLEHWLKQTTYPEHKKNKIRKAYLEFTGELEASCRTYKSFVKDESYTLPKFCRMIQGPSNLIKALFGPIIHAMEKSLIDQCDFLIKGVDVSDRPQYIQEKFAKIKENLISSDWSSFELQHQRADMSAIENRVFEHMASKLYDCDYYIGIMWEFFKAKLKLNFNDFSAVMKKLIRCSGDMWTSIWNCISNFIRMNAAIELCGGYNVECIVEGDDGLFSFDGKCPDEDFFLSINTRVKFKVEDALNEASFCGLIYGLNTRKVVTNPLAVLSDFGWSSMSYVKSNDAKCKLLLRAKALSYAYQFPGNPIITSMCRAVIRLTSAKGIRRLIHRGNFSEWERSLLLECLRHPVIMTEPTLETRVMVERLFGVPVSTQIIVENKFNNLTAIPNYMSFPELEVLTDLAWVDYASNFIVNKPYLEYSKLDYAGLQEIETRYGVTASHTRVKRSRTR